MLINPNLHFKNKNFEVDGNFLCKKCLDSISAEEEDRNSVGLQSNEYTNF
jgi:hypothetical protein